MLSTLPSTRAVGEAPSRRAAADFHGRVLATLGLIGGFGGVAGGVATAYTGFSTTVAVIAMPPMLLMIFWLIGTATVMWRRAKTTARFEVSAVKA